MRACRHVAFQAGPVDAFEKSFFAFPTESLKDKANDHGLSGSVFVMLILTVLQRLTHKGIKVWIKHVQ